MLEELEMADTEGSPDLFLLSYHDYKTAPAEKPNRCGVDGHPFPSGDPCCGLTAPWLVVKVRRIMIRCRLQLRGKTMPGCERPARVGG